MSKKTPEGIVKADVDAILSGFGRHCWYESRTSVGYGKKGVPDRTGIYRGFGFGIECKAIDLEAYAAGLIPDIRLTPSDIRKLQPTAAQEREMAKIRAAGGYTIVVGAPTHKDKVGAFFRRLDMIAQNPALR